MTLRILLSASIFAVLATVGCGNGPDDAITGTWTNTSCFGAAVMPANIQQCSLRLEFGADLTATLIDSRQSQPATQMYPRCTITRRVSGQRYSTSDGTSSRMTLTITGVGMATLERSGCANPDDNVGAMADTFDAVPNGPIPYQLNADTLTITAGPLAGSYSRSGG
jgi:hypothetical protein